MNTLLKIKGAIDIKRNIVNGLNQERYNTKP